MLTEWRRSALGSGVHAVSHGGHSAQLPQGAGAGGGSSLLVTAVGDGEARSMQESVPERTPAAAQLIHQARDETTLPPTDHC